MPARLDSLAAIEARLRQEPRRARREPGHGRRRLAPAPTGDRRAEARAAVRAEGRPAPHQNLPYFR
jgi:hypothetical protein